MAIPGFFPADAPEANAPGTEGSVPFAEFAEGKDAVAPEAKPFAKVSSWTYGHAPGAVRSQVHCRLKLILAMLYQGRTSTTLAGTHRTVLTAQPTQVRHSPEALRLKSKMSPVEVCGFVLWSCHARLHARKVDLCS